MILRRLAGLTTLCLATLWGAPASAAPKTSFNICWTIYAGWMPWDYAQAQGIVAKGQEVRHRHPVTQLNDYVESLNQYTAGKFDGCTMTNMDALTVPAASGVDSTALLAGSYSNGNDGIVLKGTGKTLEDLKGQSVHLVQFSVSHYLLARGLEAAGLRERDIKVVNTSDADIVGAFAAPRVQAVVTESAAVRHRRHARQHPGLRLQQGARRDHRPDGRQQRDTQGQSRPGQGPHRRRFEVMALMKANDGAALTQMAKAGGATVADYRAQLATTAMMYTAAEQLAFVSSPKLPDTMKRVAQFSFDKGLLGEGARSADAIGMSFPGGTTVGNAKNTKLRFDATYLKLAADGEL